MPLKDKFRNWGFFGKENLEPACRLMGKRKALFQIEWISPGGCDI